MARPFTRRPGEGLVMLLMWASAGFALLVTAAIIYSVVSEALAFLIRCHFLIFLWARTGAHKPRCAPIRLELAAVLVPCRYWPAPL